MWQAFAPTQQFGVELGEFFQAFPQLLICGDALPAVPLLVRGLEQELQDMARRQTAGQIVEGAVFVPLDTGAIGFATGGEALDVGSAQEMGRDGQPAPERGLALAQSQGGGVADLVYLSQDVG